MKIIISYAGDNTDQYSLVNNVCRGTIFYIKENIYKIYKVVKRKIGNPLQIHKTKEYILCFIPLIINNELFVFSSIDYLNKNIINATKKAVEYLSDKNIYLKRLKKTKNFAQVNKNNILYADYAFENKERYNKILKILQNESIFENNWANNIIFTAPSFQYLLGNIQVINQMNKSESQNFEELLKYFSENKNKNKFILFGVKNNNNLSPRTMRFNEHILETAEYEFISKIYDITKNSKEKNYQLNLDRSEFWGENE